MEKDSVSWIVALLIAFFFACTWIGFISIMDMISDVLRSLYDRWRGSKQKE